MNTNQNKSNSFLEGIQFFQEHQEEIKKLFINSYTMWIDRDILNTKIILAHIVIKDSDCDVEIISFLTNYFINCAGYDILFKPEGGKWRLRSDCKLHNIENNIIDCDMCQGHLDWESGKSHISGKFIDLDNLSQDEIEKQDSYDLCAKCSAKNPKIIEERNMTPITQDSFRYFGMNIYDLTNFKSYANWNWDTQKMSEIKKPISITPEQYKYYNPKYHEYVRLILSNIRNEITEDFEQFTSKFKMKYLI